jgi:hypothetical protein
MTQQEQQMLQGLTDRVNQTQLAEKDTEAEQFLAQNLGRNADALYILAQTVLVTQYGLEQAQKQIAALKAQLDQLQQQLQQAQQPAKHTSFLGGLLGERDDRQESQHPAPPPPQYQQPPQFQPVQTYQQPTYAGQAYPMAPPQYGPPAAGMFGGGGSSFLGSAMRTATGVAAGALAFEGIEDLMHGFGGHGGGYGGGFGGGTTEIINNNYYDDDRRGGGDDRGRDLTDRFAAAGDQPSPDIEDRRDDFAAVGVPDTSADDQSTFDDTPEDSPNDFDSSTFDDSNS